MFVGVLDVLRLLALTAVKIVFCSLAYTFDRYSQVFEFYGSMSLELYRVYRLRGVAAMVRSRIETWQRLGGKSKALPQFFGFPTRGNRDLGRCL